MATGDVHEVDIGDCEDLSSVDTGMYDTENYGCVYVLDADRPAIVDTGIGTNYGAILTALDEVGIAPDELEVIAVTHVHLDHAGGAGFLAEECPNATVYVHHAGADHLLDPSRLWAGTKQAVGDEIRFYTEPEPVPGDRLVEFADGDTIDLGDHELDVHHAPGHAPHQVVLHDDGMDATFVADAAGIYVQSHDRVEVTSPPPNFDLEQCLNDLDTIRDLDPSTLLYSHFGAVPRDGQLDAYETVLTEWVEDIAAERADRESDEAVVDHFVATTDLDEIWGDRKGHAEVAMNVRGVLRYLDQRT